MTAQQIDEAVTEVAKKINTDLKDVDVPIFLSVLNGSFMFTADLMRKIEIKSDGTNRSGGLSVHPIQVLQP